MLKVFGKVTTFLHIIYSDKIDQYALAVKKSIKCKEILLGFVLGFILDVVFYYNPLVSSLVSSFVSFYVFPLVLPSNMELCVLLGVVFGVILGVVSIICVRYDLVLSFLPSFCEGPVY